MMLGDRPRALRMRFSRFLLVAAGILGSFGILSFPTERTLDWEEFRFIAYIHEPLWRFLALCNGSENAIAGLHLISTQGPIWFMWRIAGMHTVAWRIPSFVVGLTGLWLMWMLARRLFKDQTWAACAVLLLCVNQCLIDYSRWALTFYALGIVYPLAVFYMFTKLAGGECLTRRQRIAMFMLGAVALELNIREG